MSNLISTQQSNFETILGAPLPLVVPQWQRSYSWGSSDIEDFWYDIRHFADTWAPGVPDYFIGTIIIVQPTGSVARDLLDGQQRIATCVILLKCVAAQIAQIPKPVSALATTIFDRCIQVKNFVTGTVSRRLSLTKQDDQFFDQHIINDQPVTTQIGKLRASHKNMYRAKRFFEDKLSTLKQNNTANDFELLLVRLQQILRDHVISIVVTMDNQGSAISVFETLNDRGVNLSTSELVRAHLLQVAPQHQAGIMSNWDTIFDLEAQGQKNVLRHIYVSTHGDVKARALSKTIKEEIESKLPANRPQAAIDMSQDFDNRATQYASIVSASTSDQTQNAALKNIGILGAQAAYPALLSAHVGLPQPTAPQRQALLSYTLALEAFYFRHVLICEREGTKYEAVVFDQAKGISLGTLTLAVAVAEISRMHPSMPTSSHPSRPDRSQARSRVTF